MPTPRILRYRLVERDDGWHAVPQDRSADERAFASAEEARAWCESIGAVIDEHPVHPREPAAERPPTI